MYIWFYIFLLCYWDACHQHTLTLRYKVDCSWFVYLSQRICQTLWCVYVRKMFEVCHDWGDKDRISVRHQAIPKLVYSVSLFYRYTSYNNNKQPSICNKNYNVFISIVEMSSWMFYYWVKKFSYIKNIKFKYFLNHIVK